MAETGVLVMAYGTPRDPNELEDYYTHIRRGRPPSPEQLAELRSRYDAIGGLSPLREITAEQVAGIQSALDEREPGRFRVALGLKHAPPFIENAVEELVAADVEEAVGLVLAPHHAHMSVGQYHERARAAVGRRLAYVPVERWYDRPRYLDLLAEAVGGALARLPADRRDAAHVVFTAHSLPARIVDAGDTYPVQLRETAQAVSERLGLRRRSIAWQSAGRTDERWLGPDLLEVLPALARAHGVRAVVVCPCGFVADHLEVLHDVDLEARRVAEEHGLVLERTAMPNADRRFTSLLADVVVDHLPARWEPG